eukprot:TRINITY_DN11416_c4_g4_i5.p1 TRINITY_DN11416_c4_g4~~TRINITY_DN11416_c4_g4_i5.p1  ORF type:complete len:222 (+),score=89.58 TRINITY_DN11416_c4_g4_i5:52-717(+)
MASLVRAARATATKLSAAPMAVTATRGLKMTAPQQSDLLESKTGKTGAAVLGLGLAAYLASKEILILHNETVVVASVAAVTYGLMKYAGKDIAATLDERAQNIQTGLEQGRKARIAAIEAEIEEQQALKASVDNIGEIFDINRELNDMTRELTYRQQLHAVRNEAEDHLTQMYNLESSLRQSEQNEIVNWIEAEVLASLKGQEDAIMKQCITDLEALAKAQ